MHVRLRLLPTVLTCIGLLVLVSSGSQFVLNIFTERKIIEELESRAVSRALQHLEHSLNGLLDGGKNQAKFIAEALEDGEIDFDDHERLVAFVRGSFAAAPQVAGIVVIGSGGQAVRASGVSYDELVEPRFDIADNPQLLQLFNDARSRREPYWGLPLYIDDLDDTLLNLRVPVWRGDDFVGLIAIGIATKALSQFALDMSDPPETSVFILHGEDRVLAHMNLVLRSGGISAENPLLAIDRVIDPVLAKLPEAVPWRLFNLDLPSGATISQIEAADDMYLLVQKKSTDHADLPLTVGAYASISSIDAPFRIMDEAAMVGASLLGVALIFSVVISRMLTRPISATSKGVTAIKALDFDRVEFLKGSVIRELDDLAASFNSMLGGLSAFGRYVPRSLVRRLIRENLVDAGTEERELTIMFTDVAGFTALCEGMEPPEVAEFINEHLTLVSACIEQEGGTIDKYIGDAVMAFWGAPDSIDDAPVRAAEAAIAIRNALAADNEIRESAGKPRVRVRIGIHSGPTIVGDIGAPSRINYTVVGDAVNTAQRLEGLGKEIDPETESIVLISQHINDSLDRTFKTEMIGQFTMKGKQQEVEVYRLLA